MSGPQVDVTAAKCDPVCQLFVEGFGIRSRYALTNVASLYKPQARRPCGYHVRLIDALGEQVASTDVIVQPFATVDFVPRDRFEGLPELGLFVVELAGEADPEYAEFGMLRPYFYATYHDRNMKSVAVVHPQTTLLESAPAGAAWQSSQVYPTAGLNALELFQINPMPEPRETTVSICALDSAPIVSSRATMGPRSVRRLHWSVQELGSANPFVCIGSSAMTAPNAKPIVFQHRNGGFSASHS